MVKEKYLIWGTGSAYETRKYCLNYNFMEILAFIENDKNKIGQMIGGVKVDSPQNIGLYNFDFILIMSRYSGEIQKELQKMNVDPAKIIDGYRLINNSNFIVRHAIANKYIEYKDEYMQGIEIGGANNPMKLDGRIKIVQVDYCNHIEDVYADLQAVKVDVIDNGEKLEKFQKDSLDFIIACHMIEHCVNPVDTIRNFLRCVKKDGIIFLTIPDKRFTFDIDRNLTTVKHLILDDKEPNIIRDKEHFPDRNATVEELYKWREQNLHYHVWDVESWKELMKHLRDYLEEDFLIELCGNFNEFAGNEITCILRKQ